MKTFVVRAGLVFLLALVIISVILSPAAVFLIVHYFYTGDLATMEWLSKITAAWTVLLTFGCILGMIAG